MNRAENILSIRKKLDITRKEFADALCLSKEQEKLLKKDNKSPDYLKSRICYLDIFDSVNFIFFFNVSTS